MNNILPTINIRWLVFFYAFLRRRGEEMKKIAVAAMKKQIPKRPVTYTPTNRADCPVCGETVRGIDKPYGKYCGWCGQRLDWSDEQ